MNTHQTFSIFNWFLEKYKKILVSQFHFPMAGFTTLRYYIITDTYTRRIDSEIYSASTVYTDYSQNDRTG